MAAAEAAVGRTASGMFANNIEAAAGRTANNIEAAAEAAVGRTANNIEEAAAGRTASNIEAYKGWLLLNLVDGVAAPKLGRQDVVSQTW